LDVSAESVETRGDPFQLGAVGVTEPSECGADLGADQLQEHRVGEEEQHVGAGPPMDERRGGPLHAVLFGGQLGEQIDGGAQLGIGRAERCGTLIDAAGGPVGAQSGPRAAHRGTHPVQVGGPGPDRLPRREQRARRAKSYGAAGQLPVQRARIVHRMVRSRVARSSSTPA